MLIQVGVVFSRLVLFLAHERAHPNRHENPAVFHPIVKPTYENRVQSRGLKCTIAVVMFRKAG